ncbi:hypothetical protein EJ800_22880 [Pseudomonas aeruginosa]|uniref:hypothetical protein n=1 Tax=Pseudomonas aeruginosa TaxID=287 RepID=UPI000F7F51EE|nr:hypothetical protein [Pseudomonas aeruginosa]RTC46922.1 hypothetical protein EJ800_22880 [Pseudomonas aeruginosa]
MKAPLRFLLGWVVFIALFAMLTPIVAAIFEFCAAFPALAMVVAVCALVAFLALFFVFFRRFVRWLDEPRRARSDG